MFSKIAPHFFFQDSIIETIRKTKCHFIHCLLPQHNAGLWELKQGSSPQDKPSDENLMNVPLIRSQIRGAELLEGVRIYRQGRLFWGNLLLHRLNGSCRKANWILCQDGHSLTQNSILNLKSHFFMTLICFAQIILLYFFFSVKSRLISIWNL